MDKTITIIAGPTASGKTSLAIEKAKKEDSVVINADSMQIYKGLPILTAQPSEEEKGDIPHKLFGIIDIHDTCSATKWRSLAIDEIETAFENNKKPILAGGTGFYMNALVKGLSPIPDTPEQLHITTINQAENNLQELYEELNQCDPVLANKLSSNDKQRIARGVEVYRNTGKPLSEWQKEPLIPPPHNYIFNFLIIKPERAWLHERINARTHVMLEQGILDEIKFIIEQNIPEHHGLVKAHGYRAFRDYFNGIKTLEEAIENTQTETRQYAKRQDTWFKNQIKEGGNVVSVEYINYP